MRSARPTSARANAAPVRAFGLSRLNTPSLSATNIGAEPMPISVVSPTDDRVRAVKNNASNAAVSAAAGVTKEKSRLRTWAE